MAPRFVQIQLSEMKELFKAEKGWIFLDPSSNSNIKEYVFDLELKKHPGVFVRVFSSISVHTDSVRKCGEDAIRVCAFDTKKKRGLVKSLRTNRTKNWRINLKNRVVEVLKLTKERVNRPDTRKADKAKVVQRFMKEVVNS